MNICIRGSASLLRTAIGSACAGVLGATAIAAEPATPAANPTSAGSARFEEIVVTAPRMRAPVLVVTDPRQPRQPLPAHDGADYLKAIPGFSVIRKGGTDGDPVFRGMAASRINISIDGQQVLGGCGMRMDPPTAYVFPEAFDRIVVVKGPQTVLEGPGNSAAAVRFERTPPRFDRNAVDGTASALAGSFGRIDLVGDLRFGTPRVYADITGTRAESDDYDDGNGEQVHSRYLRWSANAAAGWTPDDASRVELSGALSDGEAAYADRAMDGVEFARENVAVRVERDVAWSAATAVEAQAYYNYVDHVMDNYSLRAFVPTPAMPFRSVSNPDRETIGAKLLAQLQFGRAVSASAGIDLQRNEHTLRATMNEALQPYEAMPRAADGRFRSAGVFGEATWIVAADKRLVGGVRIDDWQARDQRETLRLGAMGSVPNPTEGAERNDTLGSGFARYEQDLPSAQATVYAGLGHVERFPDYWELLAAGKESAQSLSAFATDPERTTQFDAGVVRTAERLEFSLSAFFSEVRDFILIESNYPKGVRRATITRNVDARTWGGEADMAYALTPTLRVTGTVAYVRGENRTDALPLAQIPPLESRLGLDWRRGAFSAGALLRVVAEQDRYALNQGNVVGQDLGPTAGFTVVSINAGWRSPGRQVTVTTGIDNLLDRAYAEHLSRSGAMVPGFVQTTRVNEPGRTAWIKVASGFGDSAK